VAVLVLRTQDFGYLIGRGDGDESRDYPDGDATAAAPEAAQASKPGVKIE
jgi:hypothetical protein